MRSYKQRCGIAKALELIGDRWTLLIVRELLTRGACRYTDLRNGLPGIATNLLAERIRELEGAGLVVSEDAPPPVATTLYRLTDRGQELEPIVKAIGDWGLPLLANPQPDETFQTHWLLLPLRADLEDTASEQGPVAIQLEADDEPIAIEAANGRVAAYIGRAHSPQLVLRGSGRILTRLMLGIISLVEARELGLTLEGDAGLLTRLRMKEPAA